MSQRDFDGIFRSWVSVQQVTREPLKDLGHLSSSNASNRSSPRSEELLAGVSSASLWCRNNVVFFEGNGASLPIRPISYTSGFDLKCGFSRGAGSCGCQPEEEAKRMVPVSA